MAERKFVLKCQFSLHIFTRFPSTFRAGEKKERKKERKENMEAKTKSSSGWLTFIHGLSKSGFRAREKVFSFHEIGEKKKERGKKS